MIKSKISFILLSSMLVLSACGTAPKTGTSSSESGVNSQSGAEGQAGKGSEDALGVEVIGAGSEGLEGQPVGQALEEGDTTEVTGSELGQTFEPRIFFAYDQFDLDQQGLDTVKHYAAIMVDNVQETIRLVGHTDERGTPEYNLALGEKRAKAVEEAFMLYGVSSKRIEVVTMGEEQPLAEGHDEAAWAKNRRVEIEIK